jgi:hypothetical protein
MQKIGNEWYEVFTGIDGMTSVALFGGGGGDGGSAPSQGTTASENGVETEEFIDGLNTRYYTKLIGFEYKQNKKRDCLAVSIACAIYKDDQSTKFDELVDNITKTINMYSGGNLVKNGYDYDDSIIKKVGHHYHLEIKKFDLKGKTYGDIQDKFNYLLDNDGIMMFKLGWDIGGGHICVAYGISEKYLGDLGVWEPRNYLYFNSIKEEYGGDFLEGYFNQEKPLKTTERITGYNIYLITPMKK